MFKNLFRSFDRRQATVVVSAACCYKLIQPEPRWNPLVSQMRYSYCETLPTFRRMDVQREARENKKVWVTYIDGVYDLTSFAKSHPGGSDKLMMAAGGPIEPFWQMYPFHKVENIISMLAQYKVGVLHQDDVLNEKDLPDFSELQT